MTRRTFAGAIATCLGAAAVPGLRAEAAPRRLRIGHTCITWGTFPNAGKTLEPALRDIASLGFAGFETFPQVLAELDAAGEF